MKKYILISFALLGLSLNAQAQKESVPTDEHPFAGEAELGIISAHGNTKSSSTLAKATSSYKLDAFLLGVAGSYLRNSARDNDTGIRTRYEKWDVGLKIERKLSEQFSLFVAQNAESDKNAGADRRYNTDFGGKYYLAQGPGYYTFTELGYRFAHEEYIDNTQADLHFARLYVESEKFWKPTLSSKMFVEYLQNVEASEDYAINTEISLNAALNDVFSIKPAYLVEYTNLPVTRYHTDTLFSTSLIAKF